MPVLVLIAYGKYKFIIVYIYNTSIKLSFRAYPVNKVNGANMGPIWDRQDPGGSHFGPINLAIWVGYEPCVVVFNKHSLIIIPVTTNRSPAPISIQLLDNDCRCLFQWDQRGMIDIGALIATRGLYRSIDNAPAII